MATVADEVEVRIDADLGPLRRALQNANRAVQRGTRQMGQGFQKLETRIGAVSKKLGGLKGAAVTAAGASIVALGASAVRTSAEFEDLQQTLNTVFGGMEQGQAAMQFIQEFAQTTPFDIQTLTRALIQLKGAGIDPTIDLLNTFGDAASATTNKMASFEAMVRIATRAVGGGLGLEELEQLVTAGIPVYQILQDEIGVTRTEISELGQSAEGAAKIMEALNRGLNKRFAGGMARAAKNTSTEMSNLGIAFTNVQKALGDGVGGFGLSWAVGFLSDTLSQLLTIITPVAKAIGTVLGAALSAIVAPIRLVTEGILALTQGMVKLIQMAARLLPEDGMFQGIKDYIDDLDADLDELVNRMNGFGDEVSTTTPDNPPAIEPNEAVTKAIEQQEEALQTLKALQQGYSQAQIDALKAAELFDQMDFRSGFAVTPLDIEADVTKVLQSVSAVTAVQTAMDALEADEAARQAAKVKRQQEAAAAIDRVTQSIRSTIPEHVLLKEEIAEIEKHLPYLSDNLRDLADDALVKLKDQLASLDPFMQSLQSNVQSMSASFSNALADMVVSGDFSLGSLKQIFANFVKQMIAQAIQLFYVNKILGSLFGLPTTTFASGATVIGQVASGGTIQKGKPYLVGERGPELIVPNTGSTVMNNHNTKNALGGGGATIVNQTINVETGVSQTVRAEMLSLLPRFKQDTMAAVVDAKRRGGSYGSAFG